MKKLLYISIFLFFTKNLISEEDGKHFLSFIMPCYNCSKTIRKSIDSIYEQNHRVPFEIICTDDGSTDNTRDVLCEYEKKYENFHVFYHEKNLGAGAASNTCVKHSQGNPLFRLDSDNVLSHESIMLAFKKKLNRFIKPNRIFAICNTA